MPQNSARNSGKFNINLNGFVGGESVDFENGVANSFYQQEGLDFRSKSSQMTVLPGMSALATSSVLVDLPLDMVQDPSGVRWMIGDQGNLYKVDTGNVITKVATMSEASGGSIVYNQLSDMLYMTGQQTVSMYGPITSGAAVFRDKQFGKSAINNVMASVVEADTTSSDNEIKVARVTGLNSEDDMVSEFRQLENSNEMNNTVALAIATVATEKQQEHLFRVAERYIQINKAKADA